MYGHYGLKHHTVEISGVVTMQDGQTNKQGSLDAGRLSFSRMPSETGYRTEGYKWIDGMDLRAGICLEHLQC